MGVPVGQYLGLLSHSGSRGLGAGIANHYTKLAKDVCQLPGEAQHLAWLGLDTEAGQEYWAAMNLAGDYASACHHQIHHRLAKALGEKPLAKVENHHNFAWKERLADGREVSRAPQGRYAGRGGRAGHHSRLDDGPRLHCAGQGRGRAHSAPPSHGAGRLMSRTRAKAELGEAELRRYLRQHGVELIGGGLDEAPQAYKDIRQVMAEPARAGGRAGLASPRTSCAWKGRCSPAEAKTAAALTEAAAVFLSSKFLQALAKCCLQELNPQKHNARPPDFQWAGVVLLKSRGANQDRLVCRRWRSFLRP